MNTWQIIIAGDTSDVWEIGVKSAAGQLIDLGAASCRMIAIDADGEVQVDRMITELNEASTRFLAWLTGTETGALGTGVFNVGFALVDMAQLPPLEREIQETVRIEPSIFPAS